MVESRPDRVGVLLLDLDGTLIDPSAGVAAALSAATASLGLPAPNREDLRRLVGPPLQDGFAEVLGLCPEQVAVAVAAFRDAYGRGGLHHCTVYPGIAEMLACLRLRGLELAVATSKPEPFARRVLEHTGLSSSFHSIHGASLDGSTRRKADVVEAALRDLDIPRAHAMLLGDRRHDAEGAKLCGIGCIGATWGFGSASELQQAGAVALAQHPRDVPPLLA